MNVQDHDRGIVHPFVTLSGGEFLRMAGGMGITRTAVCNAGDRPVRNTKLVIEAMTALFQRRDASASSGSMRPTTSRIRAAIGTDRATGHVMQIGIDGFAAILPDPVTGALPSAIDRMANRLDEVEVADRVGSTCSASANTTARNSSSPRRRSFWLLLPVLAQAMHGNTTQYALTTRRTRGHVEPAAKASHSRGARAITA